jgi:hypothetical protein
VLDPRAVYDLAGARAALRLNLTSLKREIRQGRLKVSKRCGRYFLTGHQLLAWLENGELPRRRSAETNGHLGNGHDVADRQQSTTTEGPRTTKRPG